MSDKLNIANEMRQLDAKNRHFPDELEEHERKKLYAGMYPLLRWVSNVSNSDPEFVQYYLQSTNEQANKYFFRISSAHNKLKWLLLTTTSPGMGSQRHNWIAFKGKAPKNKRAGLFANLYPDMKISDCEMLADTVPDEDVKQLLLDMAWTDKDIKEALK